MDMSLFTSFDGRINRQKWWVGLIVLVIAEWIIFAIVSMLFGVGMMGGIGVEFHRGARMQGKAAEESRYHAVIILNSPHARMVSLSPPVCDFGRPAIDFDLPGVDGRRHTLASARGPRGLLVMFICNHCPYVKAVLDRIVRDCRELAGHGVGSIAIMSNDPTGYPEDVPVTIAWGERDRLVGPPKPNRRPAGARFLVLPGVGHAPMWDDPPLVARTLLEGSATLASPAHAKEEQS